MEFFTNKYIDIINSKLPDILIALVVLIIFWIIAILLKTTILRILNTHTNSSIPDVIGSIIKKVIIIIGVITSLGTLGVDVSGIIAGLGISGVALSLALKDIPGIRCHVKLNAGRNNYSYFPIFIDQTYPLSRDQLYNKLKDNQIFVRRYWYPLITDFS